MANRMNAKGDMKPEVALRVEQAANETGARALARELLEPHIRHGVSASTYATRMLNRDVEAPGVADFVEHVRQSSGKAENGDLAFASRMLAAQAVTLDSMFTEFARRAALNMGEYINAAERFGRLAFKAQSNSRATLEALAKLHQPREQTVKHVHVNDGGQAVIAEEFHHHEEGERNAKSDEQSHAAETVIESAALPCPYPVRIPMPGSGRERTQKVPNARRD